MDTVAKLQCYRSRGDNRHPTTVIRYAWTLELCQEHCPTTSVDLNGTNIVLERVHNPELALWSFGLPEFQVPGKPQYAKPLLE